MMAGMGMGIQSWRGRGICLGRFAGAGVGHGFGLVEVQPADVGLVAHQSAEGGDVPGAGFSVWFGYVIVGQAEGDLAQGVPAGDVVIEDAPYDGGLRFEDFQPGRVVRVAGDAPVAVGDPGGDHFAGAGAKQLAPPVPFGDLGSFVFGDDALDLGEQAGLRIVADGWGIREPDGDAVAGQLVEHDHLVGVDAGQPVRGQAPHGVDEAGLGGVTHRVQAGAVQPGAGVAVVAELVDQVVAFVVDACSQQFQLRADGAPLLLGFGGDPGVDGGSHRRASFPVPMGGSDNNSANPAANAVRRGS